jgi:hypothetical protein
VFRGFENRALEDDPGAVGRPVRVIIVPHRPIVGEVPSLLGFEVQHTDVDASVPTVTRAGVEGYLLAVRRPGRRELTFVWGLGHVDYLPCVIGTLDEDVGVLDAVTSARPTHESYAGAIR